MHLISSPSIRIVQSDTGVGIDQMALLALGTFVAGVHARAWHISMVGALLALSVPAIAWVERSAMLIILLVILLGVVAGVIWWARRGARRSPITRMTSASNRTKG
jgi:hypothetical protein